MTASLRATTARPADAPPTGGQVLIVLLASGAIGFLFGVLQPSWQDALEPAQVLAGQVRYPVHTPVYLYSVKTWTVIHQILAVAFNWGVSERALTLALSGVLGMLSLQALGVFVLALTGNVAWAVLSSFFLYLTRATWGGVTYPVILMGAPYTYGIIGLSFALLTIALVGTGQGRAGAVLLGFAPAVHVTLAVLLLAAVAIALTFDRRSARSWIVQVWPYFLAGLVAALSSATIHVLLHDVDLRPIGAGLGASASFTHHWGQAHRGPFPIFDRGMLLVWANLGLAVFWLGPFRDDLPAHARMLLKILVSSALLGSVLSISYWLPPELVPNVLYALMPSRLLNLHILTCMALVIGLAWRYRDSVWIQATLTVLVVICSLDALSGEEWVGARIGIGLGGPALIALVGLRRLGIGTAVLRPGLLHALRRVTLLAPAAILPVIIADAALQFDALKDDPNDRVYSVAAGRPGVLLTAAGIHGIQLHTRRPVLLDGGALDGLTYIPEAVAQTDTILRRVYGIDTFHDVPQGDVGGLWPAAGKGLWEARTAAEWHDIAREFGVTDVLTYSGWRLDLPVIVRSADYTLYGTQ